MSSPSVSKVNLGEQLVWAIKNSDIAATQSILATESHAIVKTILDTEIWIGPKMTPLMHSLFSGADDKKISKSPRKQEIRVIVIFNMLLSTIENIGGKAYLREQLARKDDNNRNFAFTALRNQNATPAIWTAVWNAYRRALKVDEDEDTDEQTNNNNTNNNSSSTRKRPQQQYIESQLLQRDSMGISLLTAMIFSKTHSIETFQAFFSFVEEATSPEFLIDLLDRTDGGHYKETFLALIVTYSSHNIKVIDFFFETLYRLGGRKLINHHLRKISELNQQSLLHSLLSSMVSTEALTRVLREMPENDEEGDAIFRENVAATSGQLYSAHYIVVPLFMNDKIPILFIRAFIDRIVRTCGEDVLCEQLAQPIVSGGANQSLLKYVTHNRLGTKMNPYVLLLVDLLKRLGLFEEQLATLDNEKAKTLILRSCKKDNKVVVAIEPQQSSEKTPTTTTTTKKKKTVPQKAASTKEKKAKKEVPKKAVKKKK